MSITLNFNSEKEYLGYLSGMAKDSVVDKGLLNFILGSLPLMLGYPASTKHHHVYEGGLLVHTAEVVKYYFHTSLGIMDVDSFRVGLIAALLHDHRKIADYAKNASGIWEKTRHGDEIYHVADGWAHLKAWWLGEQGSATMSEAYLDRIGHCLLSHHGRLEWRSPVEPQTIEARMLHNADMLSVNHGPGAKVCPW